MGLMGMSRRSAPEGQKNLAQGFNPGLIRPNCALKVAPEDIYQRLLAYQFDRVPLVWCRFQGTRC